MILWNLRYSWLVTFLAWPHIPTDFAFVFFNVSSDTQARNSLGLSQPPTGTLSTTQSSVPALTPIPVPVPCHLIQIVTMSLPFLHSLLLRTSCPPYLIKHPHGPIPLICSSDQKPLWFFTGCRMKVILCRLTFENFHLLSTACDTSNKKKKSNYALYNYVVLFTVWEALGYIA